MSTEPGGPDRAGSERALVDYGRVVAEIEAEARRLRREGVVSTGYERELDAIFTRLAPPGAVEDFDAALSSSEELAYIDPHAPVLSNKPVGSAMKKFVRKLVFFYGLHITEQTTKFSTTMARTTRLLGRRVEALEQALPTASPDVQSIAAAIDPGREGEPVADAVAQAMAGVEGRVAVGECGDGVLLGPLVASGIDAYGVEPRAPRADAAVTAGFEVRESEMLDHLELVPPGALGGAVLVGSVDRVPVGARVETLRAAVRAVRVGGVVAVVAGPAEPASPGARALADLTGERPLCAETWEILLDAAGCRVLDIVRAEPDADGPVLVTAQRMEP